jgi:hypothetical protein
MARIVRSFGLMIDQPETYDSDGMVFWRISLLRTTIILQYDPRNSENFVCKAGF